MDIESAEASSNLDPYQKQVVDKAFEEIFGYKWGTKFQLDGDLSKDELVLRDMLGPSAAARVLEASGGRKNLRLLVDEKRRPQRRIITRRQPMRKATKRSRESVKHPPPAANKESSVIDETKGGQKGTEKSNSNAPPVSGVSQLLQTINSTGKVSTIAKTSADWDQFKEKTGLGDHLEEQATSNTAYLNKQDFLGRVDHRTFEVEKKERDAARQKRGA